MSVFLTALCTAAAKSEAVSITNGEMGFIRGFTTDLVNAAPPPTHYMASGWISQTAYDAMVAAAAAQPDKFKANQEPWTQAASEWGVTPVVYLD